MLTMTPGQVEALPPYGRKAAALAIQQGRLKIISQIGALREECGKVADTDLSLTDFVEATSPWKMEPWQKIICERLERLRYQKGQRVLLHAPPQNGKSIIVSQRLPAYLLGHDPLHRVRLACYNETHSEGFGEVVLQILRTEEYSKLFHTRVPNRCAVGSWKTTEREKINDSQPSFKAMGLLTGFVGMGADTLIIDDPYKQREDAFSDAINDKVWRFWSVTAKHRIGPDANVVVMFHRWHEDDLVGRLLKEGGWELLRFPALCDGKEDDPTFVQGLREKGEALSSRYPREYLEKLRDDDPETFLALDQGDPIAEGGNMLKMGEIIDLGEDILPGSPQAQMLTIYQGVDLAISLEDMACYFVVATIGIDLDQNIYLLDLFRDRLGFHDQMEMIGEEYSEWMGVEFGIESNQYQAAAFQEASRLYMAPFTEIKRSKDKATYARLFERRISMGKVYANKNAHWWTELNAEGLSFPNGKYKDQIDAIVNALHLAPINLEATSEERRPPDWSIEGITLRDQADRERNMRLSVGGAPARRR